MNLETQIYLILYSYIYGFLFSYILSYTYQYIYKQTVIPKIILSFLFVLNAVFIYFICLRKINYGILHVYSFLLILLGFISEHFIINYLDKRKRK